MGCGQPKLGFVNQTMSIPCSELIFGEDILDAIENSTDPISVESILSPTQLEALKNYRRKQNEDLAAEMNAEVQRRVSEISSNEKGSDIVKTTPVLRLRVVDVGEKDNGDTWTGMISIWRPDKEWVEQLSENECFKISGLVANSLRGTEVQFKTTKQTKFHKEEKSSKAQKSKKDLSELRRDFTDIGDIILSEKFCPKFNEIDVVGIVVEVSERKSNSLSENSSNRFPNFETVYICDTLFNYAAVLFWGGLSECGFEHSMFSSEMSENTPKRISAKPEDNKPKVLIFRNLQWRTSSAQGGLHRETIKEIPCLYVSEVTVITGCPKTKREADLFREMKTEVETNPTFIPRAKSELRQLGSSKTPTRNFGNTPKYFSTTSRPNTPATPITPTTVNTPQSSKWSSFNQNPGCWNASSTSFVGQTMGDDPIESQLVRGNIEVVDGSPAFAQSLRNKKKLEKLKQAQWHIPFSPRPDSTPSKSNSPPPTSEDVEDVEQIQTPIASSRKKFKVPFKARMSL